ncbi:lytic transglycosylase domain-containing protein [Noviherbaspirillum sp.]|uniref:lytic transglycosylase domain-containing protein n=1 Tax=Noviherbaspirillum sp. TaxID=1926288 RepID=UPI002FE08B1F
MDFVALAQQCAPWVAHQTLAAIVKTESAFRPFAIGVNGGARLVRQPENKPEAVATATWLLAHGYAIDLGLGQVSSANLGKTGLSVEDAFDPCKNLAAAAAILHRNYQAASATVTGEQAVIQAALSAYNTGSFTRGFANGYVHKVMRNASAVPTPIAAPIPLHQGQTQPRRQRPANAAQAPVRRRTDAADDRVPTHSGIHVYGTTGVENVMVY